MHHKSSHCPCHHRVIVIVIAKFSAGPHAADMQDSRTHLERSNDCCSANALVCPQPMTGVLQSVAACPRTCPVVTPVAALTPFLFVGAKSLRHLDPSHACCVAG